MQIARLAWRHAAERAEVLAILEKHPVLRRLPACEVDQLLAISQVQMLARAATLFVAGDAGAVIYAVLNGFVKLSRTSASGREIVLEIVGPGSLFGELGVMNGWRRSADAVALTRCRLLVMDGYRFVSITRRHPEAMQAIMRIVSERLARATDQVEDHLLPGPARLARVLCRLAALSSRPTARGLELHLALSQRELGELAGLSRESINKQLAAWRNAKIVQVEGKTLVLTDPGALQEVAEQLLPPGSV